MQRSTPQTIWVVICGPLRPLLIARKVMTSRSTEPENPILLARRAAAAKASVSAGRPAVRRSTRK